MDPAKRNTTVMVVSAVAVALVIALITVVAKLSGTTLMAGSSTHAPPAVIPQSPTVGPTQPRPTTKAPAPPPTVDAQAAATTELRRLHNQDVATVSFSGQYVAQLASKNPGIVDNYQTAANGTHTFQATDILVEHMALRQGDNQGMTVILLLSTDYGKRQLYHGAPLWITMAVGSFGSSDDVTTWCARRFPNLSGNLLQDQCTPRRLQPAGA